jgi:hypothetical protein
MLILDCVNLLVPGGILHDNYFLNDHRIRIGVTQKE